MKRCLGLFLMLCFITSTFVRTAFAATNVAYAGVVYGPSVLAHGLSLDVDGARWWIVNAPDSFSAAVYAIGGNPYELTPEQKAYLSNGSTGGSFYTFASSFEDIGGSFDLPSWMTDYEYYVYKQYESDYDGAKLYVGAARPSLQASALADYKVVLLGGNLGGSGGGSGGGHDITTMTANPRLRDVNYTTFSYVWNGTYTIAVRNTSKIIVPETITVSFTNVSSNSTLTSWLNTYAVEGQTIYADYNRGTLTNGSNGCEIMFYSIPDNNVNLTYTTNVYYNNQIISTITTTSGKYPCYYLLYNGDLSFDGTTLTVDANNSYQNGTLTRNPNSGGYGFKSFTHIAWLSPVEGTPSVPETNWPIDNTVLPDPPSIPEPQDSVIDSQPIQPTPEPDSSYPTYTVVTVNSFTADIQGILDAMDEHCEHLQEAFWWNFNNFWQKLSTKLTNDFATLRTFLSQQFNWIVNSIDSMFDSLKDYLEYLTEWLRDELDYIISNSGYNDNTLMSWLRRIYYKLGNGSVSTKPVDPNANPDDVGNWISQLFKNLFTALDDLAGGLLTSLATLIGGLITKFPFSIPWDIAAILGLLVAEPQAPSFDIPVYVLNGSSLVQVGTCEIDLDAWTPYLTGIHMMIRVSFILFLMLKTKDFMTIMEKAVGLDA